MDTIHKPWLRHVLAYTTTPGDGGGGAGDNDGAATTEKTPAKAGGQEDPLFTQAGVDKIVNDRLARERQKYAGYDDLKVKAAEFDRLQAEQQTESERAAAALAKAQKDAEAAQVQALQYRAAAAAGIDPEGDDFALIGSGDEQTVMARAKRLHDLLAAEKELGDIKDAPAPPAPTNRPKPALRPGAAPVETASRPSSVDAAREAAIRRGEVPAEGSQ